MKGGNALRGIAFAVAVAAVVVTSSATAHARAEWSVPRLIGRGDYSPSEGQSPLVGDQRGDAALVWRTKHGLHIAFAGPGRPFRYTRVIAHRIDSSPFVVMDAKGDVVVAWDYNDRSAELPDLRGGEGYCCDHVRVAVLRAGGRSVRFQTLTRGNVSADVQALAISPGGATVAVAFDSTPRRFVLEPSSSGTRRRFVRVAALGGHFGKRVNLGPLLEGDMWLYAREGRVSAFTHEYESPFGPFLPIHETEIAQSGKIVGRQVMESEWVPGLTPTAFDSRGDQALFGISETYEKQDKLTLGLVTRGYRSSRFHIAKLAHASRASSEQLWPPLSLELAVAPDGEMLVTWAVPRINGANNLYAATGRLPSVRLGSQVAVDALPAASNEFDFARAVAVNARGQAAIMALRATATSENSWTDRSLVAILRSRSGRYELQAIAAHGSEPSVVIDAHGRGIAVWRASGERVFAARFAAP